jgi:hypothetical protein
VHDKNTVRLGMTSASHIIDSLKLQDEEKAVKQLLAENSWTADQRALIQERAITLALAIRGHTPPLLGR